LQESIGKKLNRQKKEMQIQFGTQFVAKTDEDIYVEKFLVII